MAEVGIRELRQDASGVLRRVESGEIVTITNHGRPVAVLSPIGRSARLTRDEMIAAGQLTPGRGDPLDIEPVELPPGTPSTAALLDAAREERL